MKDFSVADQLYAELKDAHWGKQGKDGMNAYGYTKYEQQAIDIVVNKATSLGMETFSDLAGNMYMIKRGKDSSKTNVIVSHVDTVEKAGAYDGRDGVVAGLVVADWLKDVTPPNDLCVMIARSEESDINGLVSIGSKAATGDLRRETMDKLKNRVSGNYVTTHMQKIGIPVAELQGRLDATPTLFPTKADAKNLIGFLAEAHIEQGNYCAKQDIDIGIVKSIRGNTRFLDAVISRKDHTSVKESASAAHAHSARMTAVIKGKAAHSGATFEEDRADAVRTYVSLMHAADEWCKAHDATFTPALVNTTNGSATTIANEVQCAFDISTDKKELIREFDRFMHDEARKIVDRHPNEDLQMSFPIESIKKPLDKDHAESVKAYVELIHAAEEWYGQKRKDHDVVFTPALVTAANGEVKFSFEIRSAEKALLKEFDRFVQGAAMKIVDAHPEQNLQIRLPKAKINPPAQMKKDVIEHAEWVAQNLGIKHGIVTSGAGHDTAQFANTGTPSVMLFIRQHTPISHNPAEDHDEHSFQNACKILAGMVMNPSPNQHKATGGSKSFRDYLIQQGATQYTPGQWKH